jgi:vacuolar protein sorting-associated protein 13A/C
MVMSPIDLEITFRTRVKTESEENQKLKHHMGLSFVNVDKASFRLNSLVFSNIFGTPEEISTVLRSHYKHKVIRNILGLCLSTRSLGNMNLLAHDLGSGFKDFFYKPMEGFVDGPIEGGKGLVIGTASLLGYTAKGVLGTTSRLINTFSKSLLFFAGDDDYID